MGEKDAKDHKTNISCGNPDHHVSSDFFNAFHEFRGRRIYRGRQLLKKVRVGYLIYEGYQEGEGDQPKSGYGYEYLQQKRKNWYRKLKI